MKDFRQEDIILILIALIFPPGCVLLISGLGLDILLNLVFLFFGWLPAALHAFYLIYLKIQKEKDLYFPSSSSYSFKSKKTTTGGGDKKKFKMRPHNTQLTFPEGKFPWEKRNTKA